MHADHVQTLQPAARHPCPGDACCDTPQGRVTLAVVGDVHDQWDEDSEASLISLGADFVIFVGDFGNEDAELVRKIASFPQDKAVVLGNHDAWYSLTPRGRHRAIRVALMSSQLRQMAVPGEAVRDMLCTLGADHVGFAAKRRPDLGLAFVGGRPFSKGGRRWDDIATFYADHFGIGSFEESAHRIVDLVLSQPPELGLVVVAHNGPTGLGDRRHSPCGVDWQLPEEDFGDPDLEEALEMSAALGRPVSLVLFGHMHHTLKGGGMRDMAHVDPKSGTVYLNAAFVPRVKRFPGDLLSPCGGKREGAEAPGRPPMKHEPHAAVRGHHFLLVEMDLGMAVAARHVWVAPPEKKEGKSQEDGCEPPQPRILVEQEVLKSVAAADGGGRVVSCFKGHQSEWEPVVVPDQTPYLGC